jgi:hypothetical protein
MHIRTGILVVGMLSWRILDATPQSNISQAVRAAGQVSQTRPLSPPMSAAPVSVSLVSLDQVTAVCMGTETACAPARSHNSTIATCDVEAGGFSACLSRYGHQLVRIDAQHPAATHAFQLTWTTAAGERHTAVVLAAAQRPQAVDLGTLTLVLTPAASGEVKVRDLNGAWAHQTTLNLGQSDVFSPRQGLMVALKRLG